MAQNIMSIKQTKRRINKIRLFYLPQYLNAIAY